GQGAGLEHLPRARREPALAGRPALGALPAGVAPTAVAPSISPPRRTCRCGPGGSSDEVRPRLLHRCPQTALRPRASRSGSGCPGPLLGSGA
ncbi:MAG TPA: hypothetical protein DCX88_01415, partial [Micrococcus luteus]|nr:hypothetical protein [Micrococcus luteus]